MRIIQISDLHIFPTEEFVNGVDTRANFIKILQNINEIDYDLLVLTGDLCFSSGNERVYIWIKKQLDIHKVNNYHLIGGNHDNAEILAKVFNKTASVTDNELYYFVKPNLIFLDTIKGYCSEVQLEWFKNSIKEIADKNPVIFMHHPPFKSGVLHMDNNYAFQQSEEFTSICKLNDHTSFVFCGHYHNETTILKDNINMYITPSTYLQIDMFEKGFKVDHYIPAFRIIDIDNSELKTTVRYVFD